MYQTVFPLAAHDGSEVSHEVANPGATHAQVVHEATVVDSECTEALTIAGRFGDTYINLAEHRLEAAGICVFGIGPLALEDAVHHRVFAGLLPSTLRLTLSGSGGVTSRVEIHWLGGPEGRPASPPA
jgi:hypothetical protein